MKTVRISAGVAATLALVAAGSAKADTPTPGTIVLNTYNNVLPQLIGDNLGPTKDLNGTRVPRVGKNTGSGYMDPQLKIDDSPTAKANFATEVNLLITSTRTDNQAVNGGGAPSYMQGAFSVVKLTDKGPQLDTMKTINLPRLNGERNWMKPNIMATDKNYLLIAASEDNGENNNPQVVAFVYDKATLAPVTVLNSNRGANNSKNKPTNLIELSGKNDNQQYGPHSIQRVGPNAFVLGVQRQNQNAYVMRVNVDETQANGVRLEVPYLNKVVNDAQHSRPDVAPVAAGSNVAYMTSVEANSQPADIGVRLLSFDVNTGQRLKTSLIAKSDPRNNKYAVQPNIANLGNYVAVSYQLSEHTGQRTRGNGNGHTGGSNLSMLALFDKATLAPVGEPMMAVAPYSRHAASIGAIWGEEGKEMPAVVSLGGSATGTGKGFAQIIPLDTTAGKLGTKDPNRLFEVSRFSDVAGTVVRGKRNPQDQARGFIYAEAGIPNPGYGKGAAGFMPEVKTFMGSAIQGYTNADTVKLAARESIWLSLVPSTWIPNQPVTPGGATPTPGTNPDGTGELPRSNDAPPTSTDPQSAPPPSVIPDDPSPEAPSAPSDDEPGRAAGGLHPGANSGCAVSTHGAGTSSGLGALVLVGLGALLAKRRKQEGK